MAALRAPLALNRFVLGEQMLLSATLMGAEPPWADEDPHLLLQGAQLGGTD